MIVPDILSDARAALKARSNARNVFVLPAKSFADFRIDTPDGIDAAFDPGGDFLPIVRNNRLYAKMLLPWYSAFAAAWNALPCPAADETPAPTDICVDADYYLCLSILARTEVPSHITEDDTALIRRYMELPHLRRAKDDRAFMPYLRTSAGALRAANARALAKHLSRYTVRACAASLLFFSGHTQCQ